MGSLTRGGIKANPFADLMACNIVIYGELMAVVSCNPVGAAIADVGQIEFVNLRRPLRRFNPLR